MRRTLALIGTLLAIAGLLVWSSSRHALTASNSSPAVTIVPTSAAIPNVAVSIDFGRGEVKVASVSAANAFSALIAVTDREKLAVKTKQYDFGVFVQSIRGLASGTKKAWIYFVNGKSGQVAADKYVLKDGDKVEWKFTDVKNE